MSDPILQPTHPSSAPVSRPQVVLWYKFYLAFLAFLFLVCIGVGALFFTDVVSAEDLDGMPPQLMGGLYLGAGIIFLIPCLVGFFLPRSKGTWVFHMVMICIGLTGCTIVFSVPLLIFWLKPEVKDWYSAR